MKLETFCFEKKAGWSLSSFPELDSPQSLVILFGGSQYLNDSEQLLKVLSAFPKSKVVGCSTSGEIFETKVRDGSISVAVVQFEKTTLTQAYAKVSDLKDSFEAGRQIASTLLKEDLVGVFLLSDGTKVNGSELLKGLNSILPKEVVVTGGLAGDGDQFKSTWIIKDGKPQAGYITAVGFYGKNLELGHASQGGWDIFGPERLVTKSTGNILHELDGRPALDLYKEYLGERASGLPSTALLFPLSIREAHFEGRRVVRTILGISEETKSMTFAGDIPEGSYAQLMRANFDRLINGAEQAASSIGIFKKTKSEAPSLTVAISCVGRKLILGERIEEEVEATLQVLPKNTKQIGFYSYGEISPYANGYCDLHNQTMTLTVIQEK